MACLSLGRAPALGEYVGGLCPRHRPVLELPRRPSEPVADVPQLNALSARDIRAFLASRRAEGVGSRSLSRTLSALRMFFRFLERRGLGKNDAVRAVALPKLPHSVPKPLTAPKARRWWRRRYRLARRSRVDRRARHRRARAAVRLGLAHLRGAVARAEGRADHGRDMLRVTGKGDKTRVVPVLPIVREAVERYLALCPMELGSDDPLFVGARGGQLRHASSSSSSRGRVAPSGSRTRRRRMRSATPSPRICSAPAPICAPSRSCLAMQASPPRKAIPRSTASIC